MKGAHMLHKNNNQQLKYEVTRPQLPTRQGIRIISEMRTSRIIAFLLRRHRVGILATTNALMISYVAYDKLHILF